MAQTDTVRRIDRLWEAPDIGTFVQTPTINIGVVTGSMGMFTVIMLLDGRIVIQPNTSCTVMAAPVDRYNDKMKPNTLVFITKGRFMGTYAIILGSVRGLLCLKPEKRTLSKFLQVAGQYETRIFVVNQTDVHVLQLYPNAPRGTHGR